MAAKGSYRPAIHSSPSRVYLNSGGRLMARRALVVVANRLPVDETVLPDGTVDWRRSPGGLVTALHSVLRERDATWIGWTGGVDSAPPVPDLDGMRLRAVPLSAHDHEDYYEGY